MTLVTVLMKPHAETPSVVNLHKNDYDVYIGRPGKNISLQQAQWGNPFPANELRTRHEAIEAYKEYFWRRINTDEDFRNATLELEGKSLGCFCKPKACHGDVIVAWFEAGCPIKSPLAKEY